MKQEHLFKKNIHYETSTDYIASLDKFTPCGQVSTREKNETKAQARPNNAKGAKGIRINVTRVTHQDIFFHMMCITGTKTGLKQFVNLTWSHFLSSLITCIGPSCWFHHCRTYLSPGGTQPYITIIPVELCRG